MAAALLGPMGAVFLETLPMQNRWKIIAVAVVIAVGGLAWLLCRQLPAPSIAFAAALPEANSRIAQTQLAASTTPAASIAAGPAPAEWEGPAPLPSDLAAALQLPKGVDRLNSLDHAIRAWAAVSPAASLAWARAQDSSLRQNAIMSVLRGMGPQAQTEIRLGLLLISQEPDHANDYALAIVEGLGDAKQFPAALQFANAMPPDSQFMWPTVVFKSWGAVDPYAALASLRAQPPAVQAQAFFQFECGWSASQPVSFADFALTLPAGIDRSDGLFLVSNWALQDPSAFSAWIMHTPSTPDMDNSISGMLKKTDSASLSPAVAMEVAQRIMNPALRLSGAESVLKQWSREDGVAALSYVQNAWWLSSVQRAEMVQSIRDSTTPSQ